MNNTLVQSSGVPHYYGDIVRGLFLTAAVIMLIGLPVISGYVHMPVVFSVIGILVLGLSAGLTNPRQVGNAVINSIIAAVGFLVFATYIVSSYRDGGADSKFFVANLMLGFIFIFAVYFSMKTVRGLTVLRQRNRGYDDD
jgi:hypothetical protein